MFFVRLWLCPLQIRDLNSGTFGFVELALDKVTGQQVAIKFIERGDKVHLLLCNHSCKWQPAEAQQLMATLTLLSTVACMQVDL